jgi:hypothetical protein
MLAISHHDCHELIDFQRPTVGPRKTVELVVTEENDYGMGPSKSFYMLQMAGMLMACPTSLLERRPFSTTVTK